MPRICSSPETSCPHLFLKRSESRRLSEDSGFTVLKLGQGAHCPRHHRYRLTPACLHNIQEFGLFCFPCQNAQQSACLLVIRILFYHPIEYLHRLINLPVHQVEISQKKTGQRERVFSKLFVESLDIKRT